MVETSRRLTETEKSPSNKRSGIQIVPAPCPPKIMVLLHRIDGPSTEDMHALSSADGKQLHETNWDAPPGHWTMRCSDWVFVSCSPALTSWSITLILVPFCFFRYLLHRSDMGFSTTANIHDNGSASKDAIEHQQQELEIDHVLTQLTLEEKVSLTAGSHKSGYSIGFGIDTK